MKVILTDQELNVAVAEWVSQRLGGNWEAEVWYDMDDGTIVAEATDTVSKFEQAEQTNEA